MLIFFYRYNTSSLPPFSSLFSFLLNSFGGTLSLSLSLSLSIFHCVVYSCYVAAGRENTGQRHELPREGCLGARHLDLLWGNAGKL